MQLVGIQIYNLDIARIKNNTKMKFISLVTSINLSTLELYVMYISPVTKSYYSQFTVSCSIWGSESSLWSQNYASESRGCYNHPIFSPSGHFRRLFPKNNLRFLFSIFHVKHKVHFQTACKNPKIFYYRNRKTCSIMSYF